MPIIYVGLDVHKETIAVALAEAGKRSEVREHGKIANTPAAVTALAVKLARGGHELRFCYEAGPCGYGIQRHLTAARHGWTCLKAMESSFMTQEVLHAPIPPTLYAGIPG